MGYFGFFPEFLKLFLLLQFSSEKIPEPPPKTSRCSHSCCNFGARKIYRKSDKFTRRKDQKSPDISS